MAAVAATGTIGMLLPACAAASPAPAPGLTLHTFAIGGPFSVGESPVPCPATDAPSCYGYQVTATSAGSVAAEGPVVVTDRLPPGFTVTQSGFFLEPVFQFEFGTNEVSEERLPAEDCAAEGEPVIVTCTFPAGLAPDQALVLKLFVTVAEGTPSGQLNTATATAPGISTPSVSEPLVVGSAPLSFGPSGLVSYVAGADGAPDTQAGDHPYEYTTRIDLNNTIRIGAKGDIELTSVHDVKDVVVDLPVGLLGDAQAAPKCPFSQLETNVHCPTDTQVGQIHTEPPKRVTQAFTGLFNMVPEHGAAAEFGFVDALDSPHAIYASVAPTPSGYVVRATTREVPQVPLTNVTATFFGDPALRDGAPSTPVPMFTNPSDCSSGPSAATVHMDSWQEPGPFASNTTPQGEPEVNGPNWVSKESPAAESPPVTGCSQLHFSPSAFTVKPDTQTADTPTGLSFDLKIPQTEAPSSLATPPLRDATVTLPAGLTVDPSAGNGLEACSEAQIGWLGATGPHGEALPEVDGPHGKEPNRGLSNFTPKAPSCPDASKIGSVEVTSPLIENTLPGSVYLARQQENPFGSLLAGYIVIDDPVTGTIVKIPGELKANPETGQITGVFDQNPQLPFSELKIHFSGGERGDLATPEACGTYTTTSDFEPWSAPESGPDATPSDSFSITNGCVSGFAPAFSAGTVSPQAGAYSPFTLSFSRGDNEEGVDGLTVSLPSGLLGKIAGVTKCSDAQVVVAQSRSHPGEGAVELASPSCPASSLLGTVTSGAGPGPDPFFDTGKAYLTGPYKGAPFGLAVIVPAIAGPFDLGTVVIRQALFVDPNDSHATDVSDPFPTILDGIPLRLQRINVTLDRPGFMFNPTSCEPKMITAIATSIPGSHAALSSRFQAAGCQGLVFKPQFTVSTQGKTSKANGASLNVKIAYPSSGQANIAKVDLQFPKILPARLTTLQKACTEAQFNTNPAGCPVASDIATVTVHTPLLNSPLTGPAYFVSHGGAAFPDVELVLQGEGVLLVVDGKTQIKKGITYSHFDTTPDAPFTTFEFNAPEGPFSILTANGSLCEPTTIKTVKKRVAVRAHGHVKHVTRSVRTTVAESLIMPTTITGQNGAVINQSTKIGVTGCPKVKKATVKKKAKRHGSGKGSSGKRH